MHQKLKTLKQKGDSSLADKYDKCVSQAEKRNFYYNHADPSVSAKAVLKKDIDMQGTVNKRDGGHRTKSVDTKGCYPTTQPTKSWQLLQ